MFIKDIMDEKLKAYYNKRIQTDTDEIAQNVELITKSQSSKLDEVLKLQIKTRLETLNSTLQKRIEHLTEKRDFKESIDQKMIREHCGIENGSPEQCILMQSTDFTQDEKKRLIRLL
jgi:hypothetical protein